MFYSPQVPPTDLIKAFQPLTVFRYAATSESYQHAAKSSTGYQPTSIIQQLYSRHTIQTD